MYVVSVKTSKRKIALIGVLLLFVLLLFALFFLLRNPLPDTQTQNGVDLRAATEEERIGFLSQFGWEIERGSQEVKEVEIPETFDEVYERYNAMQLEQGFDLSPYRGTRVKQWSYRVRNYPGYERESDVICAHILVCDGAVIGGDIANVALDGFMQTFEREQGGKPSNDASKQAVLQTVE